MAWIIGAAVLLLWTIWISQKFIFQALGICWDSQTLGQWGDTFGSLNALFAALGFIAVLYTLRVQQRQIDEARKEQHRQRFESTYFEMVHLLNDARQKLEFEHTDETKNFLSKPASIYSGEAVFPNAFAEVLTWVIRTSSVSFIPQAQLVSIYEMNVHKRFEHSHGAYYRMLYSVLRRINDDKVLTNEEKIMYGNLTRGQLGSYELTLAAINGLANFSGDFKDLIIKFRLLKYVPASEQRLDLLKRFYPEEAFAARD